MRQCWPRDTNPVERMRGSKGPYHISQSAWLRSGGIDETVGHFVP
ncbi:hypothetical protein ALQ58_200239 [Pseudomonas syringae pv. apii]|nr:hypothetical protein ALQ58_200239 [Pseudomonas syringae pv. apii]